MVFLWAFGPGNRRRHGAHALPGVLSDRRRGGDAGAGGGKSRLARSLPGRERRHCAVMGAFIVMFPRDRIRSLVWILIIIRITYIPAALLIGVWFLIQLLNVGGALGDSPGRRRGLPGARGGIFVWSGDGAAVDAKGSFSFSC